jgi:hypothetical protein
MTAGYRFPWKFFDEGRFRSINNYGDIEYKANIAMAVPKYLRDNDNYIALKRLYGFMR